MLADECCCCWWWWSWWWRGTAVDASVLTPPHVASERPRAVRVYKIGRKTVQFDNVGPAGRAISETAPRLTNTRTSTVPLLIRARRRMQFARRLIDPCRTLPIAGWLAVLLIYHSSTNDSTWAAVCVCVCVCDVRVCVCTMCCWRQKTFCGSVGRCFRHTSVAEIVLKLLCYFVKYVVG